jgi:uncharacterized membrane protein
MARRRSAPDAVIGQTMKLKALKRNNIILLTCLLALMLIFPLAKTDAPLAKDLLLNAIFFSGIFSLDFSPRSLKILLPLGVLTAATTWLQYFFFNDINYLIDFVTTFCFLAAIVALMISHIAHSREVTPTIILSAINAYLLLGVLSAVLLAITNADLFAASPQAMGIDFSGQGEPTFHDYLYFSFVTLTTLGYGDITPLAPLSRSVAVLIAITGQLYMAILIAMLVGKFLRRPEGS